MAACGERTRRINALMIKAVFMAEQARKVGFRGVAKEMSCVAYTSVSVRATLLHQEWASSCVDLRFPVG